MNSIAKYLHTIALMGMFCLSAQASQPTEEVKITTDRVMALLNKPELQGDANRNERHRLIRKELDSRFNWEDCARGCLGRHWAKRSPEEKKEFITLFAEFLERSYLDKFDTYYTNVDAIKYKGEKIIDGFASVQVVMHTKANFDHPVEYRLEKTGAGDNWLIYDTIIEGVSMIKNYRDQFDEIITTSSYEGLIKVIKSKLGETR